VNTLAILAGTTIGMLFRNGIPEKYNTTVLQAIALSVILIGLKSALGCPDILVIIVSLAGGAIIGEFLAIEAHLKHLGDFLEKKFTDPDAATPSMSTAFVTASLLFCVGSMAIVGALESGLTGNHDTLFAKSFLDGVTSIILTASLGMGVGLSAGAVLVYQGAITLAAGFMKPYLIPSVVSQMSGAGGLLIAAIGLNMIREKKIAVGNMLPAIFLPLIYYVATTVFT